jgi:hypothetical protein
LKSPRPGAARPVSRQVMLPHALPKKVEKATTLKQSSRPEFKKAAPAPAKERQKKPAEVIPFDEDEEFEDF